MCQECKKKEKVDKLGFCLECKREFFRLQELKAVLGDAVTKDDEQ